MQRKTTTEKSPLVVLAKGTASEKVYAGEKGIYTPLVLYDGLSLGVGLQERRGMLSFWGMAHPLFLINSYRGMKIAESVTDFGPGTLAACYYAGRKEYEDKGYADKIERQIGKAARTEILQLVPPNIEAIMKVVVREGIRIEGFEIEDEAKVHPKILTPTVRAFLEAYRNAKR